MILVQPDTPSRVLIGHMSKGRARRRGRKAVTSERVPVSETRITEEKQADVHDE